jgi:hypothetical protein
MKREFVSNAGAVDKEKPLARACSGFEVVMAGLLLQSFGHMPGANAAGTGLDRHDAAVFYRSDLLKVRIPHGAGFVVGMAHVVSEAGPFSTDITFS